MRRSRSKKDFVICIRSTGFRASLMPRRVYEVIDDPNAKRFGLVRVVDESGQDYLYPDTLFMALPVSAPLARAISKAG